MDYGQGQYKDHNKVTRLHTWLPHLRGETNPRSKAISIIHPPSGRTATRIDAVAGPVRREEVTLALHVYSPKSERLTRGILKEVVAVLRPEAMETTIPSGSTKNADTMAFRKEGTEAVQLASKESPTVTVPLVLVMLKSAGERESDNKKLPCSWISGSTPWGPRMTTDEVILLYKLLFQMDTQLYLYLTTLFFVFSFHDLPLNKTGGRKPENKHLGTTDTFLIKTIYHIKHDY